MKHFLIFLTLSHSVFCLNFTKAAYNSYFFPRSDINKINSLRNVLSVIKDSAKRKARLAKNLKLGRNHPIVESLFKDTLQFMVIKNILVGLQNIQTLHPQDKAMHEYHIRRYIFTYINTKSELSRNSSIFTQTYNNHIKSLYLDCSADPDSLCF